MNCPFNIIVSDKEVDTGYESYKYKFIDHRYSEVVICIEDKCNAWVDVKVGYISKGNPRGDIIWEEMEIAVVKRCARLVNPKDIVTR